MLLFSDTIGLYISIHALREEGDFPQLSAAMTCHFRFLSTPSARRATAALA